VTAAAAPLVRATKVSKVYEDVGNATLALLDISLEVEPGQLVVVLGPSGSGKTTLISILAGLLRPSAGEVELCGARLTSLSEGEVARVRRAHLGFIFQGYNLFPGLSALDNVAEVLAMRGMAIRRARERARAALEAVGLGRQAAQVPAMLSGGEKQRVAIARALAPGPSIVIADEPTAALDSTTAATVVKLLRAHVVTGSSVLLVTHDQGLVAWADRVIEIRDGRVKRDERLRPRPAEGAP
jgi:putative ABC transport system ATP-binding protein